MVHNNPLSSMSQLDSNVHGVRIVHDRKNNALRRKALDSATCGKELVPPTSIDIIVESSAEEIGGSTNNVPSSEQQLEEICQARDDFDKDCDNDTEKCSEKSSSTGRLEQRTNPSTERLEDGGIIHDTCMKMGERIHELVDITTRISRKDEDFCSFAKDVARSSSESFLRKKDRLYELFKGFTIINEKHESTEKDIENSTSAQFANNESAETSNMEEDSETMRVETQEPLTADTANSSSAPLNCIYELFNVEKSSALAASIGEDKAETPSGEFYSNIKDTARRFFTFSCDKGDLQELFKGLTVVNDKQNSSTVKTAESIIGEDEKKKSPRSIEYEIDQTTEEINDTQKVLTDTATEAREDYNKARASNTRRVIMLTTGLERERRNGSHNPRRLTSRSVFSGSIMGDADTRTCTIPALKKSDRTVASKALMSCADVRTLATNPIAKKQDRSVISGALVSYADGKRQAKPLVTRQDHSVIGGILTAGADMTIADGRIDTDVIINQNPRPTSSFAKKHDCSALSGSLMGDANGMQLTTSVRRKHDRSLMGNADVPINGYNPTQLNEMKPKLEEKKVVIVAHGATVESVEGVLLNK